MEFDFLEARLLPGHTQTSTALWFWRRTKVYDTWIVKVHGDANKSWPKLVDTISAILVNLGWGMRMKKTFAFVKLGLSWGTMKGDG
ncbi:unnamed protein product [Prunus armeniaca]